MLEGVLSVRINKSDVHDAVRSMGAAPAAAGFSAAIVVHDDDAPPIITPLVNPLRAAA